jgi:hypothetical protein
VINSQDATRRFQITLPFLFTSGAYEEPLSDINLTNLTSSGTNYLYLGVAAEASVKDVNLKSLYSITRGVSYDFSGRSVSNAGDVNGDGYDDLIIGAPYLSTCFVLFGTKHGFVNMTQGFTILGAKAVDMTGWSVSGAGSFCTSC